MISYFGILYFILFVLGLSIGLRKLRCICLDKLLIGFILLWVIWIVTGHILSSFNRLNDPWWYAVTSFCLLGMVVWGLRFVRGELGGKIQANPLLRYEPTHRIVRQAVIGFFLITFAAAFLVSFFLAVRIPPNNPDSTMYRLARIYWYIGNGSLMHFAVETDLRTLFYPLNGVLLALPVALFQLPSHAFTLVFLCVWCLAAVGIYRICQYLGASSFVSFFTVWVVLLSPITYSLATSTNDELLAATPVLLAIGFFVRFGQTKNPFFIILAGLAAGCGFGAKIHFYYYWPLVPLFLFLVIRELRRNLEWVRERRWIYISAAVLVAGGLSFSFLYYNYVSTGMLFHPRLLNLPSNRPFRFEVGFQNFSLQTLSMLLSPIVDLFVYPDREVRRYVVETYGKMVTDWVMPYVQVGPVYNFEPFRSLVHELAYVPHENTIWQGFLPIFLVVTWVLVLRRCRIISPWMLLYVISVPAWWVIFCFSVRYFETVGIHTVYPIVVAAPTLAYFWLPIDSCFWKRLRLAVGVFVVTTQAILAFGIAAYQVKRNVCEMAVSDTWDVNTFQASEDLQKIFKMANSIDFVMVHHGIQYLAMMDLNRSARYSVRRYPVTFEEMYERELMVFPMPATPRWGWVPIKLQKKAPGFLYLGSMWSNFGGHNVFGTSRYKKRFIDHPKQYIILGSKTDLDANGEARVTIEDTVLGARDEDGLEVRYAILKEGVALCSSDWTFQAGQTLRFHAGDKQNIILYVEVRSSHFPGEVGKVRYPLFTDQPFNPEKGKVSRRGLKTGGK